MVAWKIYLRNYIVFTKGSRVCFIFHVSHLFVLAIFTDGVIMSEKSKYNFLSPCKKQIKPWSICVILWWKGSSSYRLSVNFIFISIDYIFHEISNLECSEAFHQSLRKTSLVKSLFRNVINIKCVTLLKKTGSRVFFRGYCDVFYSNNFLIILVRLLQYMWNWKYPTHFRSNFP